MSRYYYLEGDSGYSEGGGSGGSRSQTLNYRRIRNKLASKKNRSSLAAPADDGGFDEWQWGRREEEAPKSAPLPRKVYHRRDAHSGRFVSTAASREDVSYGAHNGVTTAGVRRLLPRSAANSARDLTAREQDYSELREIVRQIERGRSRLNYKRSFNGDPYFDLNSSNSALHLLSPRKSPQVRRKKLYFDYVNNSVLQR